MLRSEPDSRTARPAALALLKLGRDTALMRQITADSSSFQRMVSLLDERVRMIPELIRLAMTAHLEPGRPDTADQLLRALAVMTVASTLVCQASVQSGLLSIVLPLAAGSEGKAADVACMVVRNMLVAADDECHEALVTAMRAGAAPILAKKL